MRAPRERERGEASYGPSWRRIVRDYSSGDPRLDAHALRVPSPPMPKSMVKKILRDESQGSPAICVTEPRGPDYRCATREVPLKSGCGSRSTRRLRSCRRSIRLGDTPDLGARNRRPVRGLPAPYRNAKMENAVGATQLTVAGTHGHPNFDGSNRTCLSNRRNFHCQSQWSRPAVPIAIRIRARRMSDRRSLKRSVPNASAV